MKEVALELDGVLGDTRPLWHAWLEDAARRLRTDLADLPEDRQAAMPLLDARLGNWRVLLERFAADHAAVYLRPDPVANAHIRALQEAGVRLGVFTDAPAELARLALTHLGAARRVDCVGTLAEIQARLGGELTIVRTRDELVGLR